MAVNYTPSGKGIYEKRWEHFWTELKICKRCGRASYLHHTCPDCGKRMHSPFARNVLGSILFFLPAVLAIVAVQIWILHLMADSPLWAKAFVVVICLLIHIVFLLQNVLFLLPRFDHYVRIPTKESIVCKYDRCNSGWDAVFVHWRIFTQARDAYYLDVAWLEKQSRKLQPYNADLRDELLGRSIWLSAICDTPGLAMVRLWLLSKAQIVDGFDTDMDRIMHQIMGNFVYVKTLLREDPELLTTICDSLMYDASGLSLRNQQNICIALLQLRMDEAWWNSLNVTTQSRVVNAVKYCGTGIYGKIHLQNRTIRDSLRYIFPAFVAELEESGRYGS